MQAFLDRIKEQAQKNPARIVLPEALLDDRILPAVKLITEDRTAKITLLGNVGRIYQKFGMFDLHESEFLTCTDQTKLKEYTEIYFNARKHKKITEQEALEKVKDINYYGTLMVKTGEVDAMISGTTFPTADTIRPALELLVTRDEFSFVSGFFFLLLEGKMLIFADCAINIEPSSQQLAGIALDTARTAKKFGLTPKVAMLSFSTHASAKHPNVEKVRLATEIVKTAAPSLLIDGDIQVDAALVPEVAARKCPDSPLQGDANILIFPNLESGNIGYKLVERLAKAKALGPILQGLDKPVNDLSRGCSVSDIVNLAAITSVQTGM